MVEDNNNNNKPVLEGILSELVNSNAREDAILEQQEDEAIKEEIRDNLQRKMRRWHFGIRLVADRLREVRVQKFQNMRFVEDQERQEDQVQYTKTNVGVLDSIRDILESINKNIASWLNDQEINDLRDEEFRRESLRRESLVEDDEDGKKGTLKESFGGTGFLLGAANFIAIPALALLAGTVNKVFTPGLLETLTQLKLFALGLKNLKTAKIANQTLRAFRDGFNGLKTTRDSFGKFKKLGFFGKLGRFFGELGSFFGKTVIGMKDTISSMSRMKIIGPMFRLLGEVAKVAGRLFRRIFLPAMIISSLIDGVIGFIDGFKEKEGASLMEKIYTGFKQGFALIIGNLIGLPLDLLKSLVAWIAEKLGFTETAEVLRDFSIAEFITSLTRSFFDLVGKIQMGILTLIGGAGTWLLSLFGGDDVDGDTPEIEKGRSNLVKRVDEFISKILENVFGFLDRFADFISSLFNNPVESIVGVFNEVKDVPLNLLKGFLRVLLPPKDSLTIDIPPRSALGIEFPGGSLNFNPIPDAIYDFIGVKKSVSVDTPVGTDLGRSIGPSLQPTPSTVGTYLERLQSNNSILKEEFASSKSVITMPYQNNSSSSYSNSTLTFNQTAHAEETVRFVTAQ